MSYIDVMVAPVPSAKKQQYLEHARRAAGLFKSQGALELVECWGMMSRKVSLLPCLWR